MSDEINQSLDMSGTTVLPIEIHKEMRTSFLEYSMSVIVARALPDVRDGLKPVHRRILYAMNEAGLTPNRSYKKSAWTVGEVLGKYHPHGDTAVYDTMVRMAQDWAMRVPLVDGQGNFGSVDGDGAAAMRYTESRLQKVAMELLRDLDKETVDFGPNYDESLQEPLVLPARYPNLLVNGSAGIAVGMATNIPPHNMREVIDAATMMMDNPDVTLDELMTVIHGPDFPTGGDILGREGIRSAFETGRGSLTIRGRAKIEQTKSERSRIVITEIPYQVNKSKMVARIAELVREKKLTEISDLRDESDRKGMRVVLELKRDAIPMVVLNKLFKHTQLQQSFGIIMLSLVDGVPKVLNLKEMLYYYIEHQKEVITRRTAYELRKARERAHILEGLVIALDNIDEVIAIIRASADDSEAKSRLSERFALSDAQCDAILEMRLRRLTGLERGKIMDELAQLREKIAWYEQVLGDVTLVLDIIKTEMAEIKEKFGTKRRTDITTAAKDIDIEDLIAEEDMVVTITQAGYIKRLPAGTYRQQHRGGKGISGVNLKSEDLVQQQFVASTHDYVMFFSSKGKVYRLKVHELPLGSRHARGTAIVNLLPFEQGEKVAAVINTRLFSDTEYLMFATSQGIVKKTNLKAYDTSRRDGIIAINLDEGDELVAVRRVKDGDKVIMASTSGKAIRFAEDEVRPMGRGTRGVRGMNVKGDDRVLSMEMAPDGSSLLVVTTKGYGKRTPVSEYREMHRGGQGVKTISVTDKKGPIAAMKVVWDTDLVQLVSEQGITIKVSAGDISSLGRATQGVKVMNVADEDSVQAIARRPADKKDPAKKAAAALDGQPSLLDGLEDEDTEADLEDIEGFDEEMIGADDVDVVAVEDDAAEDDDEDALDGDDVSDEGGNE